MVNFGGLVVLGPDELLGLVSLGGPVNLVALVILGPREVSGFQVSRLLDILHLLSILLDGVSIDPRCLVKLWVW